MTGARTTMSGGRPAIFRIDVFKALQAGKQENSALIFRSGGLRGRWRPMLDGGADFSLHRATSELRRLFLQLSEPGLATAPARRRMGERERRDWAERRLPDMRGAGQTDAIDRSGHLQLKTKWSRYRQMSHQSPVQLPRGRPKFRHEAAVERAMGVFWSRGYHATALPDLLRATKLSRGSLYAAFGDKTGSSCVRLIATSRCLTRKDIELTRARAGRRPRAYLAGYVDRRAERWSARMPAGGHRHGTGWP